MCGITGFWIKNSGSSAESLRKTVKIMSDALVHRGPDDCGIWVDENNGLALGHRRLTVIDLSSAGSQPMKSADGRYIIIYNGEIYNYKEIAERLRSKGVGLRGGSDTEVLLEAISVWGVDDTLQQLVGMFAFAVWDRKKNILVLARDRMGEKPLYYGWVNNGFVFASELKAIKRYPGFSGEIDRDSLSLLQRYSYIPSPYSIYKNIRKLPQASLVEINVREKVEKIRTYWDISDKARNGVENIIADDSNAVLSNLHEKLTKTIRGQMISDVPLGAFLSGGLDSSLITALMQECSSKPVKTFTIGFHEAEFDEAIYARQVAQHIGTDHTEIILQASDALSVIPKLPELYDEPFADTSQIPTCLLSSIARNEVTVCLSGDGGDELFGGYNRYLWGDRMRRYMAIMPEPFRRTISALITNVSPRWWDKIYSIIMPLLPDRLGFRNAGNKAHKVANLMLGKGIEESFLDMVSYWRNPNDLVLHSSEPETVFSDTSMRSIFKDYAQRMMYIDQRTYLPDDIMVKVDRASMGVSLETRAPFLDHRLVEFAWKVPVSMKLHKGRGKWLLREMLKKYLPDRLIERPKMGFQPPIGEWLRSGQLRDWGESLLDSNRLKNESFFDSDLVRKCWLEHLTGKKDWTGQLWTVLMFQAWKEAQ